jgi:hypothetical protein
VTQPVQNSLSVLGEKAVVLPGEDDESSISEELDVRIGRCILTLFSLRDSFSRAVQKTTLRLFEFFGNQAVVLPGGDESCI